MNDEKMKELKIFVFVEQMIIETPLIPVYILHHKEQKFLPWYRGQKIMCFTILWKKI